MDYYSVFDQLIDAIKQQVRNGRTQTELGDELGLHQATISKIIRGKRIIGRRSFDKIMQANPPWLRDIIRD